MEFIYADGGRSKYYKGYAKDCVIRAICNASGKDYKEVYKEIFKMTKETGKYEGHRNSPRNGVFTKIGNQYIENKLSGEKVSIMKFGDRAPFIIGDDKLPKDKTLIVRTRKHLTCIKNGKIYDTFDVNDKQVFSYYIIPNS